MDEIAAKTRCLQNGNRKRKVSNNNKMKRGSTDYVTLLLAVFVYRVLFVFSIWSFYDEKIKRIKKEKGYVIL